MIVGVEFTPVSNERCLQIDVPACESPLWPLPEVPDGVRVAGAMRHQDAVTRLHAATLPRVLSFEEPTIRGEPKSGALGDVGGGLPSVVCDDADREGTVVRPRHVSRQTTSSPGFQGGQDGTLTRPAAHARRTPVPVAGPEAPCKRR